MRHEACAHVITDEQNTLSKTMHHIALFILTCLSLTKNVTAWTTASLSLKPLSARRRDLLKPTGNASRLHLASDNDNDDDWGTNDDDISQQSFLASPKEERDLFIPIFAVVSLAGLFGTYAYELIRLYIRGELYLPWS
jgi:hypothetical protein